MNGQFVGLLKYHNKFESTYIQSVQNYATESLGDVLVLVLLDLFQAVNDSPCKFISSGIATQILCPNFASLQYMVDGIVNL